MNIIDAIKSGKRFRRKAWDKDTQQLSWNEVYGTQPLEICYGDVVAEDWEVEETQVTITREQLVEAYRNALARATNLDSYKRIDHINAMAEELGL